MSASASRKRRQTLNNEGLNARQQSEAAAKAEKKKKRLPKVLFGIFCALCVALIAALVIISYKQKEAINDAKYADTIGASTTVVATCGNVELTAAMYNYFYSNVVNQSASLYMYFGLQANVPLAEQTSYDGVSTYEELFIEQANESLKEYLAVYAEALANNYELTDEDKAAIETAMDAVRTSAKTYGYPKVDYYLHDAFGEGCNEANYRQYVTMMQTVSSYYSAMEETFEPTDEAVAAKYAEDPSAYDFISYTYYAVTAESTTDEESGEAIYTDEALAKAKSDADAAAASFPEEGVSTGRGNAATLTNNMNQEISDWLCDASRKDGDVKAFAFDQDEVPHSYRVVRFDSRDDNTYHRVNAYVITISVGTTEVAEGELTAQEKMDALVAGITPDMTDEAFEALVSENGYTASSNEVSKTSYNDDITAFLFSGNRAAGDYQTFTTDSTLYLVRYQSEVEDLYRDELVSNDLHESAEKEWLDGVLERHELVIDEEALKLAHTNVTLYSSEG